MHVFLILNTGFLVAMTLIPLAKLPHGFVRGPAFGRLQWVVLGLLLTFVAAIATNGALRLGLCAVNIGMVVINALYIGKFTPLWAAQSKDAPPDLQANTGQHLSVVTANVKQSNRAYDRLLKLVEAEDADIVAVVETDQAWLDALAPFRDVYTQIIEVPHDTGYGIALYSRLPLSDTQTPDLVTKGVPSIHTTVMLPGGDKLRLYIVHPEPPIPTHDTLGRDSEIALIGLMARDQPLPAVVCGDLNDVAWSTTTRRFQRLSGLLDPRVGRGFYNTFHAQLPIFRWPLDHLFHDARFRLRGMQRLADIGSDHFPMRFDLALAQKAKGSVPEASDSSEERDTRDMINAEQARQRGPIGSDWEAKIERD